jgi:hypothetical protein
LFVRICVAEPQKPSESLPPEQVDPELLDVGGPAICAPTGRLTTRPPATTITHTQSAIERRGATIVFAIAVPFVSPLT